ncbi:response regulator [Brevundimonas sp. DC300-4]|uniref:response regulator n=1 Tax=Brevundimonas sp. DC300-4 TaxID=2804594 RepID=UPI003CFB0E73
MNIFQRRLVGVAMIARARQWRTRVGLGLVIALAFFTMTGVGFAVAWLAIYAGLQWVELQIFKARDRPEGWVPARDCCWCAVGFISLNNLVFGAFAARQAFNGSELGLVGAALLIAGAIVNGVIVSAGSRHLTWASIGPQILCFSALAVSTITAGHSALLAVQIGGASLLFVLAATAASFQLSAKLKQAEDGRQAAEAANVAKSHFLANMSHEIRTPLNGVVSMADLLSRSNLGPADREMVDIIRSSGDTLTSLLGDILDMARIEAGEVALEEAPYHLGDLLRATCALFSLKAAEKNVALVVDLPEDVDRMVLGDAGRIRQVASNLISNAIKFTSIGQVSVSARLTPGGLVRLKVSDTGIGFDASNGTDVFARFQQADGSITRRFGGTGLGLSISRDLVALMGGSMGSSSIPGVGSDFWADLPFIVATEHQTDSVEDKEGLPLDHTIRILVADDNATNLKVVGLILDQAGVESLAVENGLEAVHAFRVGTFDAILMDMQMPVMDGLTAIQEIRKLERELGLNRVPIAVLSANAMADHVAAAMDAGADTHIAKPIKPATLIEAIERLLNGVEPRALGAA